jgi:hypothetical protein
LSCTPEGFLAENQVAMPYRAADLEVDEAALAKILGSK